MTDPKVTDAYVEHVLVLGQDCFETHGRLPLMEVPPDVEWAITAPKGA